MMGKDRERDKSRFLHRPNKFLEEGVRGRKTGWAPRSNIRTDDDGLQDPEDFFEEELIEDEEKENELINSEPIPKGVNRSHEDAVWDEREASAEFAERSRGGDRYERPDLSDRKGAAKRNKDGPETSPLRRPERHQDGLNLSRGTYSSPRYAEARGGYSTGRQSLPASGSRGRGGIRPQDLNPQQEEQYAFRRSEKTAHSPVFRGERLGYDYHNRGLSRSRVDGIVEGDFADDEFEHRTPFIPERSMARLDQKSTQPSRYSIVRHPVESNHAPDGWIEDDDFDNNRRLGGRRSSRVGGSSYFDMGREESNYEDSNEPAVVDNRERERELTRSNSRPRSISVRRSTQFETPRPSGRPSLHLNSDGRDHLKDSANHWVSAKDASSTERSPIRRASGHRNRDNSIVDVAVRPTASNSKLTQAEEDSAHESDQEVSAIQKRTFSPPSPGEGFSLAQNEGETEQAVTGNRTPKGTSRGAPTRDELDQTSPLNATSSKVSTQQSDDSILKAKPKKVATKKRARLEPSRELILLNETEGRGKRQRVKPVEYWRGEKVQYGFTSSDGQVVLHLKDVIRVPKTEGEHNAPKPKPRKKNSTSRPTSNRFDEPVAPLASPNLVVLNHKTGQEELLRIVWTPEMFDARLAGQGGYLFQRTFRIGSFCGSGILNLPTGAEKPNKSSGDTAVIFFVMFGKVKVHLHKSTFEAGAGTHFMVPQGNQYTIQNLSAKETRLLFMQARESTDSDLYESDLSEPVEHQAPPPKLILHTADVGPDESSTTEKRSRSAKKATGRLSLEKSATSDSGDERLVRTRSKTQSAKNNDVPAVGAGSSSKGGRTKSKSKGKEKR
ncbi:Mif2/CENP-C like-domain-containing protein [Zopfochytrium polystomum]|nr:Mif2/CENP-C like-domain-containing protein [Zopfochytrium polystomum]